MRDFQRSKVYKAEEVLNLHPANKWILKISDIQELLNNILTRFWFKSQYPNINKITVYDGRGRSSACGWQNGAGTQASMKIPKSHRKLHTILHELAHGIYEGTSDKHGPTFCANYLILVQNVMGDDAWKTLSESFRVHEVKVF